jgi:hypothetical protein
MNMGRMPIPRQKEFEMARNDLKAQLLTIIREEPEVKRELEAMLEQSVILREMREFRQETLDRFEAMDRRFEAMDRRFETMDRRFEAMDRRFEAMDRRFEARFKVLLKNDQDTRDWVGVVVGGFQTKAGRRLEDAVAGTLRIALSMPDLKPDTIKLRQKMADEDGLIGPPGRNYEYDIFVADHQTCIFEVKATPDYEDVDHFADKCELVSKKLALKSVRRVLITLAKTLELRQYCEKKGIDLA